MSEKNLILVWIPRILAICFILFISIFAFDVFDGKELMLKQLMAFFIHLIPSFILLAVLLIAWKRPLPGGWLFILADIVLSIFLGAYREMAGLLTLSVPILITGILFIISNRFLKQIY